MLTSKSNGIGNLQSTVVSVDGALRPLWRRPGDFAKSLFNLQELTHLTIALNVGAKVSVSSSEHNLQEVEQATPEDILRHSRDLARSILGKVLLTLDELGNFELDVFPWSSYMEYFRAFLSHGPRRMDTYFYICGLLDCATQLTRILPLKDIPPNFTSRMRQVIGQSREPSFRWKAVSTYSFHVNPVNHAMSFR